jgi:HlyD family secretion protein
LQAPELFVIAQNLRDMQVDASIDESDVGRIKSGQKATFTVDAFPGQTFEGAVRQVRKAAQSVANVVTYVAVVGFSNVGDRLLPGMTANVRVITDARENVLKVPNAALRVKLASVEPAAAKPAAGASADAIDLGAGQARPAASSASKPLNSSAPSNPATGAATDTAAAGPGGAPSGNPQTEFRNRLVAELALTPAQIEKVDAIYLEARPKFATLRDLSAEERPKARERMTADIRARIGDLLTPEQKTKYAVLQAQSAGRQAMRGRIYLLGADGKPVAYNVRLGITDGSSTELLIAPSAPEAALLKEGAVVVTGTLTPTTGSSTPSPSPAGPRMPF